MRAKLARPRLPRILERPRLQGELLRGVPVYPLTILCAGAGYGKTTLIASFAAAYPAGSIWYSLGPEDADFAVFLWHLVVGLRRQSGRFGRSLKTLLETEGVGARRVPLAAGAFLNDLSRIREPLAIVLDDFHLVSNSPTIVQFLSTVIENLKSPVRFVLATRSDPPLPLGRLRARRHVLEMGPAELAFTRDELRSLLEDVYGRMPSEDALDLMTDSTGGWAAAVQLVLATDAGHSGVEIPSALHRATQPGSALHDYLAEEVLDRQPADLRRWMLVSSIFDEIDPDVAGAVLEAGDVDRRVVDLCARRLLLPHDEERGSVYRYHVLLRDFLRRRFKVEIPAEERRRLHVGAAGEYTRKGDLAAAARQLALSGEAPLLAEFLRDHGLELVDQGHYHSLLSWFESLPPSLLDEEPWLRLRLGDVRHHLGDLPGAELEYERAQAQFHARENVDGEGWATVGLARIWNQRGQAARAAQEGEDALRRLEGRRGRHLRELSVRLLQVVSGARFYLGQYGAALDLVDRLEKLSKGDAQRQAAVWNNRAVVWASQGKYHAAAHAFERALERPGARRSPMASLHLSNLALLLSEMGEAGRAQALFAEALDLAKALGDRSQMLSCLIGQAHLHYRQGDTDRSLALLREVEALNGELKLPLIEADALSLRANIMSEAGQHAAARATLSQALAVYGASGRDANWLSFRIEAAVIESRAGRVHEARQALMDLHPLALELEARFPRAMLLFHLGEAERRLDCPESEEHLAEALRLGSEMGYDSSLRAEMRRNFDAFGFLLMRGREPDYVARLAAGLGSAVEPILLSIVSAEGLPECSSRAALSALAQVGGPLTHRTLLDAVHAGRSERKHVLAAALKGVERRYPELAVGRAAATGGLYLTTLGRLSLACDEGEIPRSAWKSKRALSIFVYLALQGGRGASKERLIELFWPGRQARGAGKNFHPTLSYLRNALKDAATGSIVTAEGGLYHLDPELPVAVDVRLFEAKLAEARAGRKKPDKLRAYEEAIALYGGDFLGDRYENWAEDLRTQLGLNYENALAETAALRHEGGDYEQAMHLWRRLLERNPFREEAHTQLMLCYHHLGDRAAVKEQFRRLEEMLRAELGVEPLPETRTFYQTLMVSP